MNQTLHQALVRAFRLTGVTLAIGVLACDSSSVTGDDGGTDAKGVPAQVVYVTNSVAGGQRLIDSLTIDSASGTWSQSQCGPVSATTATCSDFRTATGTMEAFMRDPLFERARRSDFAALQREYRRSGQLPPDLTTNVLRIVQGGRRRELMWESGVDLPSALQSFLCRLQQSRGALILCAE
jgi:hypothetical protein